MSDLSEPTILQRPRRWSKLRLFAFVAAATIAGFALIWAWEYWTARSEYLAAIAVVRERGETLKVEEIVERLIDEQPADSGAEFLIKAAKESARLESQYRDKTDAAYQAGDQNAYLGTDFRKEHPDPCIHPKVQERIRGADEVLNLLDDAAKRPPGLATCDYLPDPPLSRIPRVDDHIVIGDILYWVSYDALAHGDRERAYWALWIRLAFDEQLSRDPTLDGRSRRITFIVRSVEHVALCLPYAKVSEKFIHQIDVELGRWDDGFRLDGPLKVLRAQYLSALDDRQRLQRDLEGWQMFWGGKDDWKGSWDRFWIDVYTSPLGRPTIYREKAAFLRLIEKALSVVDRPDADWEEGERAVDAFMARSPLSRNVDASSVLGSPTPPRSSHSYALGIASIGRIAPNMHRKLILARLALRLRRHYDVHGRFPERLEELCDETMPKIRLDWFQNLPLVYVPRVDGFLLDVSPRLRPGPGYSLKRNDTDPHSSFAWDFKLKTIAQRPAK